MKKVYINKEERNEKLIKIEKLIRKGYEIIKADNDIVILGNKAGDVKTIDFRNMIVFENEDEAVANMDYFDNNQLLPQIRYYNPNTNDFKLFTANVNEDLSEYGQRVTEEYNKIKDLGFVLSDDISYYNPKTKQTFAVMYKEKYAEIEAQETKEKEAEKLEEKLNELEKKLDNKKKELDNKKKELTVEEKRKQQIQKVIDAKKKKDEQERIERNKILAEKKRDRSEIDEIIFKAEEKIKNNEKIEGSYKFTSEPVKKETTEPIAKNSLMITFDEKQNKYILKDLSDENSKLQEKEFDENYLDKDQKIDYVKKEFENIDGFTSRQLNKLGKKIDVNVYELYKAYDKAHGTQKSLSYCASLTYGKFKLNTYKSLGFLSDIDNDKIVYNYNKDKQDEKTEELKNEVNEKCIVEVDKDKDTDLKIVFDSNTKRYILKDIKDKDSDIKIAKLDTKYLDKNTRKEYINNEFNNQSLFNKLQLRRLRKRMDINLYEMYKDYDKTHGTKKAVSYCASLAYNKIMLKTFKSVGVFKDIDKDKIEYDFRKNNLYKYSSNQRKQLVKIVNKAGSKKIAEVKNPRVDKVLRKGLAVMLTAFATVTGAAGVNGIIDTLSGRNTTTIEQNTEKANVQNENTNVEETKSNEAKSTDVKEKVQIGVGSKTTLDNEKYTEVSDGTGKSGSLEDKANKEVTISMIAAVNGNEVLESSTDKTIDELKAKYPDAKIAVNVESTDGVLGWINYSDVENKFEDSNKVEENQVSQEAINEESNENQGLTEEEFNEKAANWRNLINLTDKNESQELANKVNSTNAFKNKYRVDLSKQNTNNQNVQTSDKQIEHEER